MAAGITLAGTLVFYAILTAFCPKVERSPDDLSLLVLLWLCLSLFFFTVPFRE